ncbi:hypothetical protein FTO70_12705 [Methanosarcina sp. KYL-1]|uniref:hypothetical protein n=1 Tax=Methanosarcina sp. KYL-1 TaxID=2602068 RepID=UPI002100C7F9|nr:hypothetical protein [Methanosarcina sp. KYL-1]MCQ1536514.1 hypothetical protein [Methanosarcina sp. KYL-1]
MLEISRAFLLGLLIPLTAVCVIPLYPGFLAYLSNQSGKIPGGQGGQGDEHSRKMLVLLWLVITAGVITFILIPGFLFTTILQVSLTKVIGVMSPIAFGIFLLISLILIFDVDMAKYLPRGRAPRAGKPYVTASLYGFFFGAVVIPFQLFSAFSAQPGREVIAFLVRHRITINLTAGIVMFVVSVYYLVFVFRIFG